MVGASHSESERVIGLLDQYRVEEMLRKEIDRTKAELEGAEHEQAAAASAPQRREDASRALDAALRDAYPGDVERLRRRIVELRLTKTSEEVVQIVGEKVPTAQRPLRNLLRAERDILAPSRESALKARISGLRNELTELRRSAGPLPATLRREIRSTWSELPESIQKQLPAPQRELAEALLDQLMRKGPSLGH